MHAAWALDLLELLNIDPESAAFTAGVVAVVLAAWYALWRKAEPHIPDWLTRLVLGSAKAPTYDAGYPTPAYTSGDTVELLNGTQVVVGAIIMDPGARMASYQVFHRSGDQSEVRESDIVRKV